VNNLILYNNGFIDGAKFHDFFTPGEMDVYIVDEANFIKFNDGLDFFAAVIQENVSTTSIDFNIPHIDNWYAIASNKDSTKCAQKIEFTDYLFVESDSALPQLNLLSLAALILLSSLCLVLSVTHKLY